VSLVEAHVELYNPPARQILGKFKPQCKLPVVRDLEKLIMMSRKIM
jgi:hypothetical protein